MPDPVHGVRGRLCRQHQGTDIIEELGMRDGIVFTRRLHRGFDGIDEGQERSRRRLSHW